MAGHGSEDRGPEAPARMGHTRSPADDSGMPKPARCHVAVLHAPYIEMILAGIKTVEARLSRTRRAPFGMVLPGERIYLKVSGGPVRAVATASAVRSFADMGPLDLASLSGFFGGAVGAPEAFWADRAGARYATFVSLTEVRPVAFGPELPRRQGSRGARTAWHVLPAPCDPYPRCLARPGLFEDRAGG